MEKPITSKRLSIPDPLTTSSTTKYLKNDLQHIFKTILEAKILITLIAILNKYFQRLFKAKFPNVYHGKTHMECYNFCQQCKNYFAMAGVKVPNYILFVVFFF